MLIYLLRHGLTEYNAQKRYQGQRDIPLSAEGLSQLRRADIDPKVVYITPLQRTAQTARVLFPEAELVVVKDLQEMCFGSFEGKNYVEMEHDADYQAWVQANCESKCPDGERKDDFSNRICNAFSALVLPQIISEFNRLYPGVDVKLSEGNIAYLEEKLFKGDLDLVLDNHPMDESIYQRELFYSEQLLLAVPVSDPVCTQNRSCALTHADILSKKHIDPLTPCISMETFQDHTFIALRHGNDTRIQLDSLCEQAGFTPKIQLEVDQLTTAYNIVCNNIGITLVSDTLVTRTPPVSNLVYYKINSDHTKRFAYFYYKNSSYVTLAMREFIKLGIDNIQ